LWRRPRPKLGCGAQERRKKIAMVNFVSTRKYNVYSAAIKGEEFLDLTSQEGLCSMEFVMVKTH
jgi:hypothetical protein